MYRLLLALFLLGAPAVLAQANEPVHVSASLGLREAQAYSAVPIHVEITLEEGWHIWARDAQVPGSDFQPILTSVEVISSASKDVTIHSVEWPEPVVLAVPEGVAPAGTTSTYYIGKNQIEILVMLPKDLPVGDLPLLVAVTHQACSEHGCNFPVTVEIPLQLEVIPGEGSGPPGNWLTNMLSKFDLPELGPNALWAFIGGLCMLFMPCVLPTVSLKLTKLSNEAGSRKTAVLYGFLTFLGIVSFWMAFGAACASFTFLGSTNALFQLPGTGIVLGIFIVVMGFGMLEYFEFNLPSSLSSVNPMADSPQGAYLFGVMTAVLATPCTGPFMGSMIAWALSLGSVAVSLVIFGAVGVGMGLPFLILTFFPKLTAWLPKAGPGSLRFKYFMGLMMLVAGIFFLGGGVITLLGTYPALSEALGRLDVFGLFSSVPWLGKTLHVLCAAALAVGSCVWVINDTFKANGLTSVSTWIIAVLCLALLFGCVWFACQWTAVEIDAARWQEFDRAKVDQALAEGKVAVVDFTAVWCINCKALEMSVLCDPAVKAAFDAEDVEIFKADVTSRSGDGWMLLQEMHESTPLLLVYGPARGADNPIKSNFYGIADVLGFLDEARGTAR